MALRFGGARSETEIVPLDLFASFDRFDGCGTDHTSMSHQLTFDVGCARVVEWYGVKEFVSRLVLLNISAFAAALRTIGGLDFLMKRFVEDVLGAQQLLA